MTDGWAIASLSGGAYIRRVLLMGRKKPRVYVEFRHRNASMRRIVDLEYIHDGTQPVAVISWIKRHGSMEPEDYVELDERLLRKATPVGMYRYEGVIEDPRFPPPKQ